MKISAFILIIIYTSILMAAPVQQAALRATTETSVLFGKATLVMETMEEEDYRKKLRS